MAIKVVLFDLGGVLIQLGGMKDMAAFAREEEEDELWRRWLSCPWVRRFETGQCDAESFAQGMVDTWSMTIAPAEFLAAFKSWPRGFYPGAREMVQAIETSQHIACFSNTNELHADRNLHEFGISDLFASHYYSHEMGVLKPDREAFEFVVDGLGCAPDEILFLDDNLINVDGAKAAGLLAEHARGPDEAKAILIKNRLLRI